LGKNDESVIPSQAWGMTPPRQYPSGERDGNIVFRAFFEVPFGRSSLQTENFSQYGWQMQNSNLISVHRKYDMLTTGPRGRSSPYVDQIEQFETEGS